MGRNWKMPLLSTLAALVILVHSAEEELEREQRLLGPRLAHHTPANYDQTWRAIEVDPIAQQSQQIEAWEGHGGGGEEAPRRRRRPGRKQKRRPIVESEEREPQPQPYTEPPLASEPPEPPRRKRKRPEMRDMRWAEEPELDRPLRRRGQRRKRPIQREKVTELEIPQPEEPFALEHDHTESETVRDNNYDHHDTVSEVTLSGNPNEDLSEVRHSDSEPSNESHSGSFNEEYRAYSSAGSGGGSGSGSGSQPADDRALSEASNESELSQPASSAENLSKDVTDIQETVRKAKAKGPIDPRTLKEILKKSNGTSLSEILQQNNLSLNDLLYGRQNAISATETDKKPIKNKRFQRLKLPSSQNKERAQDEEPTSGLAPTEQSVPETTTFVESSASEQPQSNEADRAKDKPQVSEILDTNEDAPKIMQRRRLPNGGRRKLRLKAPMRNGTIKYPVRDFTTLNTRRLALQKKLNESRKAVEFNTETQNANIETNEKQDTTTTTVQPERTTTSLSTETVQVTDTETTSPSITTTDLQDFDFKTTDTDTTQTSMSIATERETGTEPPTTEAIAATTTTTTEKPMVTPMIRSKPLNNSELRRQALTNRLKRKRLKQKNSTTESPQEDLTKDLFGMANLVSASEFIAKTHSPKSTTNEAPSTIEDMVTEATTRVEKSTKRVTKPYTLTVSSWTRGQSAATTTEETAKFEIEEILNDRSTGARLSKILRERNMTFDELVEHRERGSSQVHLADIFHNASREPSPTEPFLSKSSIEPISKETYPLRALLEANLHDPALKATTLDPTTLQTQQTNIPVVMDFKSNVNENSENLGIVSLFNKITNDINVDEANLKRDSTGSPYVTSVVKVNVTKTTESNRDARGLELGRDLATLNEIFSLIHGGYKNDTKELSESIAKAAGSQVNTQKTSLEEDIDGDGLIVLEDLQHLNDFDSKIASSSEERLDLGIYDRSDPPVTKSGVLDKTPSSTKSVTVATASMVGLTMVVFLMTYAAFKWRQQRSLLRKKDSFCEEHIPTPVFESRKGSRNHSSSRSISPMLPSANIYTMSTLDSRNGKDSPDYMWDSLRKPFQ